MEQTLVALGRLLPKTAPTIVILIFLFWYFRAMLFDPLTRILKQRAELTEGARRAAEKSLKLSESKTAEYEQKFAEARAEIYKFQEETRKQWLEEHSAQVAAARKSAEATVRQAKGEIAAETDSARNNLADSSTALAQEIADSLLVRRSRGAR